MNFFTSSIIFPLGILIFSSGLVTNFLQVLTLICLLPLSRSAYRRVNSILMELLWSELVWLMDWWAKVEIEVYVDNETWKKMGKEHALLICNHRSDMDWLVGWVLAQRVGCLGSTRAVMKKSSKFLPVVGWSMWFSEYTFLERDWVKDEAILKESFQSFKGFPRPFWLALFVEGTRFTEAKLQAAQEHAASKGLPIPRNVLIPRTKGFVSAVTNLRSFMPAVYDITIAIPKGKPSPTLLGLINRQPTTVQVHIRRYLTSDLPISEEGLALWCKETFMNKDDLLEKHKIVNGFGDDLRKRIAKPVGPLLIVLAWSAFLLFTAGQIFGPLLSSWVGIAWIFGTLATIFFLMQVFILFTQSERSTPVRQVPQKRMIVVDGSQ
ncbi:hypothetical protein KP509_27G007400 [Ceratopteris richardii]|uniref:1-acylglycerol-3-phosphate O-acyltransferase n=3 Tax=Ceratopteris richardii TaxID=49495 RepID=A0A8T2RDR8_CERRI|nr:hypothetical protein KP509_27G007400 [Ceratopteris richardii]